MCLHRVKNEMCSFDRPLDLHRAIKLSARVAKLFVERFT